jgi:hypothetical protein
MVVAVVIKVLLATPVVVVVAVVPQVQVAPEL